MTRRLLPLALLGATLLAGCGRDEPGTPTLTAPAPGTVIGTASKGPLHGATVAFYPLGDDGLPSGPAYDVPAATTDANGKFVASGLPTTVPILVQTSGGSYFDESDPAANRRITFGVTDHLEAVLPAGATFMTITPYSMALYKKALAQAGGANFVSVYEAVQAQATAAFGFDPITTTPANPLTGLGGSAAGGAQYGILLGAAALGINQSAVSAGHLPDYNDVLAFILDIADGQYDAGNLDTLIRRFRNNNAAAYADTPPPAVDETLLSNHPPLALDDGYATAPGTVLTVTADAGVLVNDFDNDGETLTAARVSGPSSGTLTLNADGGFTYTPANGFTGTTTFTYRANDGSSGSNVANVTINVSSQAQLYGAWAQVDGSGNLLTERLLAIFADGTYAYGGHDNDLNCSSDPGTDLTNASDANGNGAEYGTWTWDPVSGAFTTPTPAIRETNGSCGFSSPNIGNDTGVYDLVVDNGDLLIDGALRFRRVPSTLGTIRGGFLLDGSLDAAEPFVVAFFPSTGDPNVGRFFMVDVAADTFDTSAGIEEGCYTITTSTHVFVPDADPANCTNAIDTTGAAGFDGDTTPPAWMLEAIDSERLSLHPDDIALPVILTRLPLSTGADRPQDADVDGLSNDSEATLETDPAKADTDGDGVSDFLEVNQDGDPNSFDQAGGDSDPLNENDKPGNDTPSLDANFGLTLDGGTTQTISIFDLSASDPDSLATTVVFTVTTPPSNGTLEVNGVPAATSFTQADLDGGFVNYTHTSAGTTADSFAFTLSDASGFSADCPSPAPCTFAITVNLGPGSLPLLPYFTGAGDLELFDPLDPANPTSVETALPTSNLQSRTLLVGDVSGGVVSNIHASRIVYVKDDGSTRTLWKVNLEPGASRTPVPVSNHANICRINGIAEDFVNAENTFLRLDTADASGNCEGIAGYDAVTAEAYLVQLSTGDTQAGTQIGVGGCCGIAGIATSAGAVAAVLTTEDDASGSTFLLRRRNVGALGTPIEIATLDIAGQGPTYGHLVRGFGDQHIYIRANRTTDTNYKLLRFNVASNTLTELYDYGVSTPDAFGEDFHHETYDGTSVYFNNAAGTGLLKVDHTATGTGQTTTLFPGSAGNPIVNVLQAGTRIVVETEGPAGGIYSVVKTGGSPATLAQDDAVTPKFVTLGATNGAKVFINEASFTSYNARVVNADGSGPLDEADSQWAGQSLQTSCNFAANCEDAASSVAIYLRRTAAASDGYIEIVDPATGVPTDTMIGHLTGMNPGASIFGMGFGRFAQFTAFSTLGDPDLWLGDRDAAAPVETAPTFAQVSNIAGADDHWLLFGDGGGDGGGGGADTDGDGLTDAQEAALGTNPNLADSDSDGLTDFDEVDNDGDPSTYTPGTDTDPQDSDTDNDGLEDGSDPDPLVPSAAPWQGALHGGQLDAATQTSRSTLTWPAIGGHTYRVCATVDPATDADACSDGSVISNDSGVTPPYTLNGLTAGLPVYLAVFDETVPQRIGWTTITPEVYEAESTVWDQYIDTDGTRYVGGEFVEVYRRVGTFATFSGLDSAGHAMTMPRNLNEVNQVVPDGQGGVYIAGEFDSFDGQPRYGLAQLDRTGQLTSWNPQICSDGTCAFGSRVYALYFDQAADILYVGGELYGARSAGGGTPETRGGLAAFTASTGALLAWNPNVTVSSQNAVYALTKLGGTIYAGGSFTSVAGGTGNRQLLAAFEAADVGSGLGTLLSWNPGASNSVPFSGNDVRALLAVGTKVYVGGTFNLIGGGGTGSTTREKVAAVDAVTGVVDSTWNPGANSTVLDFALDNGVLYVSGAFTTLGGQSRTGLAAVDPASGVVDSAWNPGVPSGTVFSVKTYSGTVVAGGTFGGAIRGTGPIRNGLAAFESAGTGDGTGALKPWDADAYGVYDFEVVGDVVYAGGYLQGTDIAVRKRLAAFDRQGNLDLNWAPSVGFASPQTYAQVLAMTVLDGTLYVGGDFNRIGPLLDQTRLKLAAFDAVNSGDGTGAYKTWNPQADGFVDALVARNGVVYAGGGFSGVNGILNNRFMLAAFDASTGTMTSWNPGTDAISVRALAFDEAGNIYAGGDFDAVGGGGTGSTPRSKLAAFDTAGNVLAWNPGASSSALVYALVIDGGTVYAGGTFTAAGGGGAGSTTRNRLAAFDSATTGDGTGTLRSWNPAIAAGTGVEVRAIAAHGGAVYVGGDFSTVNGVSGFENLAALDPSGALIPGWNVVTDGDVYSLVADAGVIYAGGAFFDVGTNGVVDYQAAFLTAFDAAGNIVSGMDPALDADGDGLTNGQEAALGTDPDLIDSDDDGLDDGVELAYGGGAGTYEPGFDTDPTDADSDNDDVGDGIEVELGSNPKNGNVALHVSAANGSDAANGATWATARKSTASVVSLLDSFGPYPATASTMYYVLYDATSVSGATNYPGSLSLSGATARSHVTFIGGLGQGIYNPKGNTVFEPTSGTGTVVLVSNATNITVGAVEIRNGNATGGAGVRVTSTTEPASLKLIKAKIHDNTATQGDGGGALVETSLATLTLQECEVYGNSAANGATAAAGIGRGGGIAATLGGIVNVVDSVIRSNSATNTSTASPFNGGGGIYAENGGSVTVTGSVIADNKALNGPGGGINLMGIDGATVRDSMLLSNGATRPGGGLHVHVDGTPAGPFNVFNNLIVGNASTDGDAAPAGPAHGAGVEIEHNANVSLVVSSNTIAYNQSTTATAPTGGGLTISPTTGPSGPEFRNNIVIFNNDAQLGAFEATDNAVVGLPSTRAGNDVFEPSFAGNSAALPNGTDPLFELGFYLDQLGAAVDAGNGQAGDANNFPTSFYTTDVGGSADSGAVDIGFHHAKAGQPPGSQLGLSPVPDSAGCPAATLTLTPLSNGTGIGPGHLVVASGISGPGTPVLSGITALDPLGTTNSVVAIDQGDGSYRLRLTGSSAGTYIFNLFVDGGANLFPSFNCN